MTLKLRYVVGVAGIGREYILNIAISHKCTVCFTSRSINVYTIIGLL